MANKQVTFSLSDEVIKLQKSLEGIAPALEAEVNAAIRDLAYATYASVVAKAQANLKSTRESYINAIKFDELGDNSYLISLDGERANAIEDGWAAFDMRAKMLVSTKKVTIGSRAGLNWVQIAKDGHKYAYVPIHKNLSEMAKSSNLADSINALTAMNAQGREQKITQLFKDTNGNALLGKVAMAKSPVKNLNNVVKYQTQSTSEAGNSVISSSYITYRTVSENGKEWQQPGYAGLSAFKDAENDILQQLDKIIKTLL